MWRNRCRLPVFAIQLCPQQSFPVLPTWYTFSFISTSNSRHNVFLGLLLYHFSLGFHVRVWHVIQFNDFFNVCFLSTSIGFSWNRFVLSYRRLLLMISGKWTFNILCRKLFRNTCSFFIMDVVILQDSIPYDRTALMHVLKILILADSCFENI